MSTEKINDGGPAFPHCFENLQGHPQWLVSQGMTLRDWFAGQAMSAIIAGNNADAAALTLGAAKDAYAMADAMLAARSGASS